MLRRLQPADEPIDLLELVFGDERGAPGRPWLIYNMVASVDGATAFQGGSSALNDEDDKSLFAALRAVPDVILAGAGTVRAEDYRPVTLDDTRRRARIERGLEPTPRLAIPTRLVDLDPGLRVFSDPDHKPLVITGEDAPQERVDAISDRADIVQLAELTPVSIVAALIDEGLILCEGGPTLNGQLMASGFVDEVLLTISPLVALGKSFRVAHGVELESPFEMRLDRALVGDRALFLRYLRATGG